MDQARSDCTAHIQPPTSPLGFALVFTDVELLWWSPSRLVSGCFWCLHQHRRPSLMYHPTCKRTFLEDVGQQLDSFRVWQICVRLPRNQHLDWELDLGFSPLSSLQPHLNMARATPQGVIGSNCPHSFGNRYICIFAANWPILSINTGL